MLIRDNFIGLKIIFKGNTHQIFLIKIKINFNNLIKIDFRCNQSLKCKNTLKKYIYNSKKFVKSKNTLKIKRRNAEPTSKTIKNMQNTLDLCKK